MGKTQIYVSFSTGGAPWQFFDFYPAYLYPGNEIVMTPTGWWSRPRV